MLNQAYHTFEVRGLEVTDHDFTFQRCRRCCCNKICRFRDAVDAVRERDGYNYDGYTLRVEFPRGSGPGGPEEEGRGRGGGGFDRGRGRGRGDFGGGRGGFGGFGGRGGGRGGPPSRRSEYRVLVSGI